MNKIDCWKCEKCGRIAFDGEEMAFHENTCDGFRYSISTITDTKGNKTTMVSKFKGDNPNPIECRTLTQESQS